MTNKMPEMNLVIDALKNAIKQLKDFNSKLDEKYPIKPLDRMLVVGKRYKPLEKVPFLDRLVNALEAEKDMSKPEPKWLPISCAPKCGSIITVKQKDNKRHKIFKAQWFSDTWYSLYKEGGNEQIYPELWFEGSK